MVRAGGKLNALKKRQASDISFDLNSMHSYLTSIACIGGRLPLRQVFYAFGFCAAIEIKIRTEDKRIKNEFVLFVPCQLR